MTNIFEEAATSLGWKWSVAHGGYISENHRNQAHARPSLWSDYRVAADAEEACFWDGVETMSDARCLLRARV